MPKAKKSTEITFLPADVYAACFNILAIKGLGKVRLTAIAEELDIPLADLYAQYPSVQAILACFADSVDKAMIDQHDNSESASKRERYFDMIMTRFDALQAYREGVKRWITDLKNHPDLWVETLYRMDRSMSLMLDLAKDSPLFPVKKLGITAIYLTTLHSWLEDESADMSKTMSALDTALGRGEMVVKRYMSPKRPKTS